MFGRKRKVDIVNIENAEITIETLEVQDKNNLTERLQKVERLLQDLQTEIKDNNKHD